MSEAEAGILGDVAELVAALKEARTNLADWAQYAPEYFQEKWDLAGDIEQIDAVIRKHDPTWEQL